MNEIHNAERMTGAFCGKTLETLTKSAFRLWITLWILWMKSFFIYFRQVVRTSSRVDKHFVEKLKTFSEKGSSSLTSAFFCGFDQRNRAVDNRAIKPTVPREWWDELSPACKWRFLEW